MNILILNQTFYPDATASARQMWDLSRFLTQRGHTVTVLAGREVVPANPVAKPSRERVCGVHIRRVDGVSPAIHGRFQRALDWWRYHLVTAIELCRVTTPDVIIALTSPPMIAALGGFAQRFFRTASGKRPRFVFYVNDLYPDAGVAHGDFAEGGMVHRILAGLTARTLRAADAVVVLGRDMENRLISRYGQHIDDSKIRIVLPWHDGREVFPIAKEQNQLAKDHDLVKSFNVVYSGNFGVASDYDTIAKAVEITVPTPKVQWVFTGSGPRVDVLRKLVKRRQWLHAKFLPDQSLEKRNAVLNLADVHILSQLPAYTGITAPFGLSGAMAVGRPIVMVGPEDAECARIITGHGIGFVVANGAAEQLAMRLWKLCDDPGLCQSMGRTARQTFEQHFDFPVACARLEQVLAEA